MTRNAIIIAVGFAPLFLSSLVPYLVVVALLSMLMILSGLATMLVLPALVTLSHRNLDQSQDASAPESDVFETVKT